MENYLNIFRNIDKHSVSAVKAVREIESKFSLESLIQNIITNDDWVNFICKNSYIHSNSFMKLSLFSGKNIKARLHIYQNSQEIISNIHDHRWDFASLIISGGYISNIYDFDESGTEISMYSYKSDASKRNSYTLDYIDKVKIKKITQKNFSKGDINHGNAGQIHSIKLKKDELTISLFITTHYEIPFARVFISNDKAEEKIIKSEKMKREELLTKLKVITNYDKN